MSRCLGDLVGHAEAGLSCEPEVTEILLSENDKILLLCSDGVWEFISPEQSIEYTKQCTPETAMQTANALAKEAWNRWIREEGGLVVDDITVLVVHLQEDNNVQSFIKSDNSSASPI